MDPLSVSSILKIVSDFGLVGLIIFLWWSDAKRERIILDQYKRDMDEQRKMYESNASLCRDFSSIARDLRDIVTLNIQKMTQVEDAVRQNQFCPLVRVDLKKAKIGLVQEGADK
jgi:hypothetical protein